MTKRVFRLYFTSVHVPVRSREQKEEVAVFAGDILPLSSGEGERPAHTKGSLTPSHCLFLVITSTTIEGMGQGEARTLVRGRAPEEQQTDVL